MLGAGAGQRREGGRGRLLVLVVDQQAGARVGRHRGEGGVAPAHQPQVELEVGHHPARQQRDEVAVAGQPRVHAGERRRRDRGTADVVGLLQDQDPAAGPGEVRRGRQPVVSGTHDDVVVRHAGRLCPASVLA